MTQIKVRIVPDHADTALRRMRTRAPFRLATTLKFAAEIGKGAIVERTPRGASGVLAESYQTEMRGVGSRRPRAIIANPVLYSTVREKGRLPGKMPPPAALMPWVGSKLGIGPGAEREAVAFLVARKIGRVGYEGSHHEERGWKSARRQLKPLLRKLGFTIVRDIR